VKCKLCLSTLLGIEPPVGISCLCSVFVPLMWHGFIADYLGRGVPIPVWALSHLLMSIISHVLILSPLLLYRLLGRLYIDLWVFSSRSSPTRRGMNIPSLVQVTTDMIVYHQIVSIYWDTFHWKKKKHTMSFKDETSNIKTHS